MAEPALAEPLRALLSEEPGGLVAAWLFGSFSRGEERRGSDVDVGVPCDRPPALAERLGAMAGFRNVLVQGYGDLDLAVVEDVVENRTGDLLDFVREIRQRTS